MNKLSLILSLVFGFFTTGLVNAKNLSDVNLNIQEIENTRLLDVQANSDSDHQCGADHACGEGKCGH
ncbi:MAG: hypothetical protein HRT47_06160 [Candidatus Caenarcaniphilales bacterium]|nr:hypothetical protein [Candidatus Caenarcaniphilales bacterium]